VLVQAEVSNQSLELPILILQLLETPQLANAQPAVQLLPPVKVCSEIPIRRITSATGAPVSACFIA
jgi:hypothetical protein